MLLEFVSENVLSSKNLNIAKFQTPYTTHILMVWEDGSKQGFAFEKSSVRAEVDEEGWNYL